MNENQDYFEDIETQNEMTEVQEAILGIIALIVTLLIGIAIGYFICKRQK